MKLTTTFLILSASLLSACAGPPDVPSCRSLEVRHEVRTLPDIGTVAVERANPACLKAINEFTCGYCVWSISPKVQYVGEDPKTWLNGKSWSVILRESVKVPAESYAKIKAAFINMCKQSNQCTADIARWRVKLDALDSIGDGFPAPPPAP